MMQRDTEKEWYYGNKEKERLGPFSFKEVRNDGLYCFPGRRFLATVLDFSDSPVAQDW